MNRNRIVIGTRSSQLALWQADYVAGEIQRKYPDTVVEKQLITTKGDRIIDAPLARIGGKGLFTKELETAMLAGEIDIAVHSLKDMPVTLPEGLKITAVTRRTDPWDALVSPQYKHFDKLPPGARIGTSSLRRRAQLLSVRPDLDICNLRGNVNTRLRRLEEDHFDGIILASVGLKRLGLGHLATDILGKDICLPAVGQGALAIESRADDTVINEMIAFLDDSDTSICTGAERAFLGKVQGGCQVPVGVYASIAEGSLHVEGVIASLDGACVYRDEITGNPADGVTLGCRLAEGLLAAGGQGILQELGIEI
ncbi:MAG: hydroxymethylbilane synthase [Anaerovibrio sp.]|uniref:hydroxymethylbilane synthase n=1 Tax=Anaerovibrio sp. TaxID=1872532 RepID=UPI0025FC5476|nr:hydroxymethylbilane synthase [Anaerovibrio sp.]MCR5176534.1 hydroxymethylbilane synthase [Anaerovibrio sp.]